MDKDVQSKLKSKVASFARLLRAKFAAEIGDDERAREFKRVAVRTLKLELPPGPGRPKSKEIDEAVRLRSEGTSWAKVCTAIEPKFPSYSPERRFYIKNAMRNAVTRRLKLRKSAAILPTPENQQP